MAKKKIKKTLEKIIGRKREQKILKDLVESKKSEFIAIYGRRRIGKTFLIKNFMESQKCIFFHVTGLQKATLKDQLEEFAKQIGMTFYKSPSIIPRDRWKDAFEDLNQAISKISQKQKIILFLDEFPWMATPRSKLLTILELFWNRYWVFDKRIKLIICGSATSWIIENIINNKGGLHNRVTRSIRLKPFSLYETKCYLKAKNINLNNYQILELYIAFGGIPLYWSFIHKGYSAHQCIDELCFQNDGPLVNEFYRLFQSLFEEPKPYTDIIRILAKHRYGVSQSDLIIKAKLPDGGTTIRKLNQLEEAGFITSLIPYGHKNRGIYYVIDDEYSLFFICWIEPNLKTITKKAINKGFWVSQANRASWNSWVGLAFESICYKHLDQIKKALKIDPGAIAGTWRYSTKMHDNQKGTQIDLLFDRSDKAITLCEIKFSGSPFIIDKEYSQKLLNKIEIFKKKTQTKKQLFLAMITSNGLKPTMYSEEIVTNQTILEDLFKES